LKTVKETPLYQKTSEVVAGTAETIGSKLSDMRNSNFFKSFETKIEQSENRERKTVKEWY